LLMKLRETTANMNSGGSLELASTVNAAPV